MPDEVKKYVGRGGWRGGGRPKLKSPADSQKRPNNSMRAWPDEWKLIKRFQRCVIKNPAVAEKRLEELEDEVYYYHPKDK
jgi:hypothetical protein